MTTKLVIPTILAATILIAGMFAFMPVEKAATIHTTLAKKGSVTLGTQAVGTYVVLDLGAGNSGHFDYDLDVATACTGTGTIAITGVDAAGNTITLNAAAVQGIQHTVGNFVGRSISMVVATAALATCVGDIATVAATGS